MKKQLLASTALMAAGLLAQQAGAQTAFQGPGSAPATTQNLPPAATAASAAQAPRFVIRISGFFTGYVGGVWQDDRGPSATNAANTATAGASDTSVINNASPVNADVIMDSRIRFNPEIALDNGFRAGGLWEIQTNGSAFTSRRTFAYLASDRFGEIRLGNQSTALTEMLYREASLHRGYSAGVVDSAVIQDLVINPSGQGYQGFLSAPDPGLAGVARTDSINYFTPRIEGFQIGVSFSPELNQNRNGANTIPLENGSQATYRNGWAVAANFNRTFDPGIVVRLSGGYARAYAPDQGGQGSSLGSPAGVGLASGTGSPDPYWWYVGGYVGYAGFTLGASYGRGEYRNFTSGSNNSTPAYLNTIAYDGYAWAVSGTYNYGPFGIGVSYMDARQSDCNTTALAIGACGSRDRNTVVVLNGSYQLGPGVFWEVGVFHAKISGNEWSNGTYVGATPIAVGTITSASSAQSGLQDNRATGVWTGLAIVF
jgi:predicted porin